MRLNQVELDEASAHAPPPELEQELRVAIFDLLEENSFLLPHGPDGPYKLRIGATSGRLLFHLIPQDGAPATDFSVSTGPLRQIFKDYTRICHSYYDAVKSQSPSAIEMLDDARRRIHSEGGRCLAELMETKAVIDAATARRLFTLVCALSGTA